MPEVSDERAIYPRVADFYDGKSVFMTGAAGFLGVVILESLLEFCPGIQNIYILLRAKKGVPPEKRKDGIFKKQIFDKLKQEQPEVFEKVQVVTGDVSKPDLGMSEEDLEKIILNATIVFHCAASINFLKPLRYILEHNALGTQYAIEVCRKLNKVDAFVYTSTAYSNSNRKSDIQESIYRMPFPSQKFLDEIKNGTEESVNQLVSDCYPNWPNSYTFSKSLAENILQDHASDFPVAIIRPSIIGSAWKRPVPGYVEENSGITSLSVGAGKGFLQVLHGDPKVKFDFIPVDVVSSIHMIAAWSVATKRSPSPLVVNCTSFVICTLRHYSETMCEMVKRCPLPKTFRTPTDLLIVKNNLLYWIIALFEHYIPAYFLDFFLKLNGSKIRIVPIYRVADKAMEVTFFFMSNDWRFHTENFNNLIKQLDASDKKMFEVDVSGSSIEEFCLDIAHGAPFYNWSIDKKSQPDRMRAANQRYWLTCGLKAFTLICIFSLLYLIFSLLTSFFH